MRDVIETAFSGSAEAGLVERLRDDGDLVLALVAASEGRIVGHVAFSRLRIAGDGMENAAVALAPFAVTPARQRQGIGTELVRRGLDHLARRGEALVFVLGDPAYYRRFGFEAAAARGFASPYDGPHFQALRLAPSAPVSGLVRYPAAFVSLP